MSRQVRTIDGRDDFDNARHFCCELPTSKVQGMETEGNTKISSVIFDFEYGKLILYAFWTIFKS